MPDALRKGRVQVLEVALRKLGGKSAPKLSKVEIINRDMAAYDAEAQREEDEIRAEIAISQPVIPVPVDDIERLLRASEAILGIHREGKLLMRRVQKWLDEVRAKEQEI